MNMKYLLVCCWFVLCPAILMAASPTPQISDPALRARLLAIMNRDQAVRLPGKLDLKAEKAADARDLKDFKAILRQYGWPTEAMVGKDGSQAAWLLVQHADSDSAFQKKMLATIKPLAENREIDPSNYGYLYDRVVRHEKRLQRYGTQGQCVARHKFRPFPVQDPAHLDSLRAQLGMQPEADYIRFASGFLCVNGSYPLRHRSG